MTTIENVVQEQQTTLGEIDARILVLQTQLEVLTNTVNGCVRRTEATESGLQAVATDAGAMKHQLNDEKARLTEALQTEFDGHKAAWVSLYNTCRDEVLGIQTKLGTLYGGTADAFGQVREKVEKIERDIRERASASADSGASRHRGFLPLRSMVPASFDAKDEEWRRWSEDVVDYMDSIRPGMAAWLKLIANHAGTVDEDWITANEGSTDPEVLKESVNVFRALKSLTKGEARVVVQGVRKENGFLAWKQLHMRFGLAVAAKQGQAMSALSTMAAKPAKQPAETRKLLVELEQRVRYAEDITGRVMDDQHIKSILAAFLDPLTRSHTSSFMGTDTSFQQLKRAVLEFVGNNVMPKAADPDAMVIGRIGVPRDDVLAEEDGLDTLCGTCEWPDEVDPQLAAVSATTRCFRCGGIGHLANKCPTPVANKGKGKGGGAAIWTWKGRGQGMVGAGQRRAHERQGSEGQGRWKRTQRRLLGLWWPALRRRMPKWREGRQGVCEGRLQHGGVATCGERPEPQRPQASRDQEPLQGPPGGE